MVDQVPAVEINRLTKVFETRTLRKHRVTAVEDVTLVVPAGEIYGLIGPNGSGKSTTMKVLLGLLKPTRGTAAIFGRDSSRADSRHDVGFLPENPYFYKHLTGEETLRFYGRLCGLKGAALTERINELLAMVGLEHARDRRLAGYSKGMLQRIGLAQAIIHRPRLVLLDEPTAGVDPAGSRKIRDLIFELKSQQITVILSSHLLEQVQEVCDRVGIMARGELLREGRLDDLISVETQTEYVVENAPPELKAEIEALVAKSGAKLVEARRPQRTLEKVFLEVTSKS